MDATNVGAPIPTDGHIAEAPKITWWVYEMPPMDWDWPLMHDVLDVLRMVAHGNTDVNGTVDGIFELLLEAESKVHVRCRGFSTRGLRNGPSMFFVPGPSESMVGFVWKRDRGGTTYVASTFELPHLTEWLATWAG